MFEVCNSCDIAACCSEQVPYILHEKNVFSGLPACINHYQQQSQFRAQKEC
jgi:hypothetical protein